MRWKRLLLVLGFIATAVFRVHLCLEPPAETTDVLRHLGYGRAFWIHGLRVFDLTPGDYVMYCNVAGHYKLKMYGTLTVK